MDTEVPIISKDKLSKTVYEFRFECGSLEYCGIHYCYRDSVKEKWSDDESRKSIMSYEKYCDKFKLWCICDFDGFNYSSCDSDCTCGCYSKYEAYKEKRNPVCQKTKYGKPKYSGIFADIKSLPKCPEFVAKRAKINFAKNLKVIYK